VFLPLDQQDIISYALSGDDFIQKYYVIRLLVAQYKLWVPFESSELSSELIGPVTIMGSQLIALHTGIMGQKTGCCIQVCVGGLHYPFTYMEVGSDQHL